MIAFLAAACVATPCAFVGAQVQLGDGTTLPSATVIVQGGKIQAVGAELPVPEGAERIELEGKVLTPGLIEAQSQIGLFAVGLEASTVDHTLAGSAASPGLRVSEAFDPKSVWVPITREEGVTRLLISPTGGVLPGAGYAASLSGEFSDLPDPKAPVAFFASLNAAAVGGSRAAVWAFLRALLADARWYQANAAAYDAGKLTRPLAMRPEALRPLAPLLAAELPLVFEVNRARDILAALAFAKEEGLRLVIAGGAEAWRVAEALAEAKVPVILNPAEQQANGFDAVMARDDAATLLDAAGVPLILSAYTWDQNARRLRQVAGLAVAQGLAHGAALKAITQTPAQVFGQAGAGSLRPGADADFVIWSGDPFELSTVAERVFIGGVERSLDTRQRKLAERYLKTR